VFNQDVVDQITNTPLFSSVDEDRLAWTKETNGEYSV